MMAPIWGLAIPLPSYLSLSLLSGLLACGVLVLFFSYQRSKQVAAKTDSKTSKQDKLKKAHKLTAQQLEENMMGWIEAHMTCISGFPVGWTQEYILWSMDRSLQQIFQHLENARSSLIQLGLQEPPDMISSTTSSILVAQETVVPPCDCKKAECSADHSFSSGSSASNSKHSCLSVFSEGKSLQFRSSKLTLTPQKPLSVFKNKGTSLPPFQSSESEKSNLLQNLATLSSLPSQSSLISSVLEPLNLCKQEKTKDARSKRYSTSDNGPNSISKKTQIPAETPIRLPSLVKGELEGHMSWKVCTLQKQIVPQPVKESWAILNYLTEVQGVPKTDKIQTQLSMPTVQNTEQNTNNKSPDLSSSFQLHVNIGVESRLNRTETKISQSFISGKQSQPGDGPQILESKTSFMSVGTQSSRSLGVNIIEEETTILKDPKQMLGLSIEQRIIDLTEKRIQQHKAQVTNVESTPKLPYRATDSLKVTPLALLKVMNSMGMVSESSHPEVMESDQIVKPTEAMEMVNITPKPLNRAIESVAKVTSSPQHHVIESESKVPGTWNQVTDNVKVTPLALLQVMGSMGMINKPHPRVTETVEMIPGTLLHQVLESDKMDTWLDHQAIKPEQMSTRLPYKVTETIKITPGPQHKVTKSVSLTSGSQSQASEQVKMIPGPPINQNKKLLDMISTSHEVNDCKVTPVALLKAMDVMGLTALAQTHAVGARDLTPFSQPQIENLTPSPTQPDSLTCSSSSPTSVAPVGVAESGARIILTQSDPRIHSLNTTPMALWAPKEMITAPQSQVLESHDLTLIPISQVKESKALTPWLQNKGLDSVEESLQPQHQAAESAASVPEPHQVIDSSRLIPQHQILKYSEGSPTLSPKVAENIELTSNTWLHMGKLVQLNDSQHQIIESVGIIPRSPGQGTESVEMKQKSPHQVTESPTLTNTSLLQDANYTEVKPMPQLKVMDDMKLSLELKTVKSKNLALQPKFSSIKFTDITTGLDSQMLKCKQMIPTVDSIDLAPVPKQESAKLEELAITLQLHSGKCEQTTPRSPSQGVKSIQLTLGPQLQTVKSAESASAPQLQNRTSTDLTTSSQIQGMKYDNLSQSPEFQDLNAMELALTPLLKDRKSVAPIPSLQNIRLEKKVPGPLLEDVKIPELGEYSRVIPATQVQEMKHKELISGINFQAVKSEDINSKPFNQATGLEGLRPHSSEKLQMASEPEYQGTKANLTTDPCHLVKESIGQLPLGITPRPLSQTSGSMKMTSVSLQDTVDKTPQLVKAMGETLESQHETKESLDLNPELEIQSVRLEVLTPEPQSQDIIVHLKVEPCSKATKLSEITLQSEYDDNETVRMALPEVDNLVAIPEPPYSEIGSLELALGPGMGYGKSESPQQNWQPKKIISESSPFMVGSKKLFTEPRSHAMDVAQGAQQLGIKSTQLDPEAQSQDEKYVNVIQQSTIGVVESEDLILQSAQQRKLLEELTKGAQFQNLSLQQANIQSYELTLGPQLQSVRFSKFPPESLLKGEKPFDLVSGPTHYDMKSDELISDSSMLESKVSGPRQQSTRIEQLIPEPQCEGMNFVELSPGPCLQDIKFSDLTSGPKLQGVKFGEDTPRSRVYGGNSVEATPELGLHDSKFVKISPNIHMKQVGLNSGPCLQDVKFFDLTPEIQPQGMKSSELNSGPQLQCVKFSDLTSEPEKQGVTSAQLTPRPERQGIKSESLEPELLLRGIKLVMANQMPNSEGKMSCELTSEARKPGIESLVLVPGPQLPKLSYSEFTRRQKLQESKLIQGSKMKVVKLVEQTLVSNLQGLKSKQFPSELQSADKKSVMLNQGHYLGGIKSMQLKPKPKLGNVNSVMLTSATEAGGVKPGELIVDSNLQGLKPKMLTSGLQFGGLKSVPLTAGPNVESTKSKEKTPRPQLEGLKSVEIILGPDIDVKSVETTLDCQHEDVKSMELTPSSKILDFKTMELVPHTQLQDAKAMELKLGPKMPSEDSAAFVPELLQSVKLPVQAMKSKELISESQMQDMKCVENTPSLKLQSSKPIKEIPDPQLQSKKSVKIHPRPRRRIIKSVDVTTRQGFQGANSMGLNLTQPFQWRTPIDLTPGTEQHSQISVNTPERTCVDLEQLNTGSESEGIVPSELIPKPQSKDVKSTDLDNAQQWENAKLLELAEEFECESELQSLKSPKLTLGLQLHQVKPIVLISEPQLTGVKTVELNEEPQTRRMKSIQWIPRPGLQDVKPVRPHIRSQSLDVKCAEFKPFMKMGSVKSSELIDGPKFPDVKPTEMSPGSELQKDKLLLTSEPQLQSTETVELSQFGSMKSIQWIPAPEFQGMKYIGLNLGSQSLDIKSANLKYSTQLESVKSSGLTVQSKLQDVKSAECNCEPQLQCVKIPELCSPSELQKGKHLASISEPQLRCMKTGELNQGLQLGSMESTQWLSKPEFQGIKSTGLNVRSQSLDVKHADLKHLIQLENMKASKLTVGPKFQCAKSMKCNCGPKLQCVKIPEFQKRKIVASISEPQLQCTETGELNQRTQLRNIKAIQKVLGSGFLVTKTMLNLSSESQNLRTEELKSSIQLTDVKSPELTPPRPTLQSTQPLASFWDHQPQGFKIIDLKPRLQLKNMKSCDPTSRSKFCNIKSMKLKSGLPLQDGTSPELTSGPKLQEMKSLESCPGTQLQNMKSLVFTQGPKIPGVKCGMLSQESQLQSDKTVELNCPVQLEGIRALDLPLQTKLQDMKSEKFNSGLQQQDVRSFKLTPEKKCQDIKFTEISPLSQLKSIPFPDFIMGTKIQDVTSTDPKPGPLLQDMKSSESMPSIKLQEMKLTNFTSGPQLEDVKSSRLVKGIELQDKKYVGFCSGPRLQTVKSSQPTPGGKVQGVNLVEFKFRPKLQGDLTLKEKFSDVKSVKLNSSLQLQFGNSEQITDMKFQNIKPMDFSSGTYCKGMESSKVMLTTKPQGMKSEDFNSEPQIQSKNFEFIQGTKLQDVKSVYGPTLQTEVSSELMPETKLQGQECVEFSSGPQLQDVKYSKLIPGAKIQDVKSMEFSSGPSLQSVKSSAVIPGSEFQTSNPLGFLLGPLWQNVKSLALTLSKVQNKKCLESDSDLQSPEMKSMWTLDSHPQQGMKSMSLNPGAKLQCIKSESTDLPKMDSTKVKHNTELPVAKLFELPLESKIHCRLPSKFNARKQQQDEKSQEFSQWPEFHSEKLMVFNRGPHLQQMKSSELCKGTRLQDMKSMEFNPEEQFQKLKSESYLGTQLQGMGSLEFNPGPKFQGIKSELCKKTQLPDQSLEFRHKTRLQGKKLSGLNLGPQIHCDFMTFNTGSHLQDVKSFELNPRSDQEIKPEVFCLEPHLQDVNSAASIPVPQCHSTGGNPGSYLQDVNNSASIPGLKLQRIKSSGCMPGPPIQDLSSSACTPGSHNQCGNSTGCNSRSCFQGMSSSERSPGSQSQCGNSSGCHPEPCLQYMNSSACSPVSQHQCGNSSGCHPEPCLQYMNSSACSPGSQKQCGNSSGCHPESHLQCMNSSARSPEPQHQCGNSSGCHPEPCLQCMNSSACSPGPQHQCGNSSGCQPGPCLQSMNSSAHSPRLQNQSVNSTRCNFRLHLQGVKCSELNSHLKLQDMESSELNSKTETQKEIPLVISPRPHSPDLKSKQTQESKFLYVAPVECNSGSPKQYMSSSELNQGPKSQWVNSMGCKLESYLQSVNSLELTSGTKCQRMRSSELHPGSELQGIESVRFNSVQHSQDVKHLLTPKTKSEGIIPMEFNCGQWQQENNCSESNSESELQCINSIQLNPSRQIQGMNTSELNPGLGSQDKKSILFSSEPHLQGVRPSELTLGTKFQGVQFLQNHLESQQQVTQPMYALGPRLNVKSVLFLSEPLLEETKPKEMKKHPLLCGEDSVKLISGSKLQDLNCELFILKPYFNKVKSMELYTESQTPGMNSEEMPSHLKQHSAGSMVFVPKPCFQDMKSMELKLRPQPQDVNSKRLISCISEKSAMFVSKPQSQDVKSNQWSQSQNMNPSGLTSCLRSQGIKSVILAPNTCLQNVKPIELRQGSQQQDMNYQELISRQQGVKEEAMAPQPTRKFLPGPILSSVKFSDVSVGSQQQGMKSSECTPEPKLQNIKHVKLSSVSLQQTALQLAQPQIQGPKSEEQTPRENCHITESSKIIPKPQSQLTSKPTGKATESSGMPLNLQVSEFTDLNLMLRDQSSKSLDLTPGKSYEIPDTLALLSQSCPPVKDSEQFYITPLQHIVESERITPECKHHTPEVMGLTSKARLQGKEFLVMAPKSINQDTGYAQRSPVRTDLLSCPRASEPVGIGVTSGKRWQKEESVVLIPKSLHHIPDSASRMTPELGNHAVTSEELTTETGLQMEGLKELFSKSQYYLGSPGLTVELGDQVPELLSMTSKQQLQMKEPLELPPMQENQGMGHAESIALIFDTCQQGEASMRLRQTQNQCMKHSAPQDKIKFVKISPNPLYQVTESARTQHVVQSVGIIPATTPKIVVSKKVTPGGPVQAVKSVTTPEPTLQMAEHVELTSKLQDERTSEFTSSLWLQNMKSKKLITEPTHQILETMKLTGSQIVKSVLTPKPSLQIVKSEKLEPRSTPQFVEPIGVTLRPGLEVIDCLGVLPRQRFQERVKSKEATLQSTIQVKPEDLTSQQAFPFKKLKIMTQEQRLQTVKPIGIKTEYPKVIESKYLDGQGCQNSGAEESEKRVQTGDYFSSFPHSSSTSLISNSVRTSELGSFQQSGMLDVQTVLDIKNFGTDILQSKESCTDPSVIQSPILPWVLHNQPLASSVETPFPEIPAEDVISQERTTRSQLKEFENQFQIIFRHPPQSWRSPPRNFQARLGAHRGPISSLLGRQQNVWENHVSMQRLPRKYLSTMLMLGNVLGTTMEKKLHSRTSSAERITKDICQSVQKLFGIPAELMEFSQSLLEKGPGTISQSSMVKNYIQRHTLCPSNEKKMALRMWTRSSTYSIIQQYSGTRFGIKKTSSRLRGLSQDVIQHMPMSCAEGHPPETVKSESSLMTFYRREDPVPMEESENSQSDSQTRTFESQHFLKPTSPHQAKSDVSEQFQLLQDLQLKIAAKLLRSQIPPNVPPPLASGLVLKYPICLQCGRCLGFNCCHKLHTTFGPYLLIYPQIHLVSTPEGHGEIRLHLGFRLRTGKKSQVSKYGGREKPVSHKKAVSPPQRKGKIFTKTSKSSALTTDFQSGSSQSPSPVQVHIRRRQCGSPELLSKRKVGESEDYEFTQIQSLSDSDSESNQDEKWVKVSTTKSSISKHPKKRLIKRRRVQNTRLHTNSRTTIESSYTESPTPSRRKRIASVHTSTASLKRQSKKSSQPKFIQLLFQGLKQACQTAHRIIGFVGQKPEDRIMADSLPSSKTHHAKQKARGGNKSDRMPVGKQSPKSTDTKQEYILAGVTDQCNSPLGPTRESSFRSSPLPMPQPIVPQLDIVLETTSVPPQPLDAVQNDNNSRTERRFCRNEISRGSKDLSQTGTRAQARGRIPSTHPTNRSSPWDEKLTHKERSHRGSGRERVSRNSSERNWQSLSDKSQHFPSERSQCSPSERTLRSLSERNHRSRCRRNHRSPSERTLQSLSERGHHSPLEGRRGAAAEKRRPREGLHRSRFTEWSPRCPSERSHLSSSERRHRSPSEPSLSSPASERRRNCSCAGRTRPGACERGYHSPRSERSRHSHSERSWYSHSERSQSCPTEKVPHSPPKERLQHSSPKRRPRHGVSKDVRSCSNTPPRNHTKKPQSRESLEA